MANSILFPLFVILFIYRQVDGKVSVSINNLDLTLKNDHFSISFDSAASVSALIINGENIVKNVSGTLVDPGAHRTFYTDYYEDKAIFFAPTILKLINQTEDFAHVVYIQDSNETLSMEVHHVITSDVSGLYQYVLVRNNVQRNFSLAVLREVCRFNPYLMEYINNGKIQRKVPKYEELEHYQKVQDETWLLPNGTYYTKYDLAGYIRERHYFGVLGGGYGAWTIYPSHEYITGSPLAQDNIGHQDSLMLVHMASAHFGTPPLTISPGFVKFHGPWLIYFNRGSDDQLVEDVKIQTRKEIEKWPYNFVHDKHYPLFRGAVTGDIKGPKSMVFISSRDEVYDQQVKGYAYSSETTNGKFTIENIRPGDYLLSVYPLEGVSAGTLIQRNITIIANQTTSTLNLNLVIEDPPNIVWHIGETNRRTTPFRYSNESRNHKWMFLPPANLTFEIGKSTAEKDWYYAQTKPGFWNVMFNDTKDNKNRLFLLSLAGASWGNMDSRANPQIKVFLNGHYVQTFTYENDKALYRSAMQSGAYHFEKIHIPAELVLTGVNKLSVQLVTGSVMYDCLVYHTP